MKVIAVMEDCQVGQILCAACPDSRTLITGGKNTVKEVYLLCYVLTAKKERGYCRFVKY